MEVNKQVKSRSTIKYPLVINPEKDAERINKSIKLMNPDEDVINEILGHRSLQQRLAIQEIYKRLYDKEITEHIGSVLIGSYDSLIKTLFRNPMEILANDLYKGIKNLGSNYQIMTDIICCCNNTEIYLLKKAYEKVLMKEDPKGYRQRSLHIDIMKESKGSYKLLMEQLLKGERCEDNTNKIAESTSIVHGGVDQKLVDDDVTELYEAGEGQIGKGDPSIYISILSKRSKYHIREICKAYQKYIELIRMISHQTGPSITFPDRISAENDAEQLHNACKLLSTDEETITKILGHRNLQQRYQIRETFHRRYKKDLVHVLCNATKGDYESLIKTLFRGSIQILAHDLYKGLKKPDIVNEIICCCNNNEIIMLKKAYQEVLQEEEPKKASQRTLETDIIKETKPPYEQLLVALLQGKRDEDPLELVEEAVRTRSTSRLINRSQVDKDVEDLYYAGEKRAGKGDSETFIKILTKRSKYHVKEIWDVYLSKYHSTIVEVISKKFSEPFRSGLNTMIMALIDLRLLLVCQLYDSMYGLGTREDTLIRITCLRCEIDMNTLKSMYREYFGKPLIEAVREDTSGDFRKLLLALLGE
ncbi:unnamed protein product [Schistosoma mattheei]|uniref:Annexin n=3 Tax=Schistosoma mattheei TaxID=31246 RepID=A0AA85ARQ1_9TREM|nr:unnamed protein product [Schistosoma mattheei]